MYQEKAEASTVLEELGLRADVEKNGARGAISRYALLTLHRPANVDNQEAFVNILGGLEDLAADCPIVFPVHPRTQQRIREFGLEANMKADVAGMKGSESRVGKIGKGIVLTSPRGYLDFLCLMKHASLVVTDSGGIQEETTCLGIPCVTARENTERPVTVESGTNVVAGTSKEGIRDAIRVQMLRETGNAMPKNWDGQAAKRILEVLIQAQAEKASARQSLVPQTSK